MHQFTLQLLDAIQRDDTVRSAMATLPSAAEAQAIQTELVTALGGAGAWKVSPWSETAAMAAAPIPRPWIYQSGQHISVPVGTRIEVEFALVVTQDNAFAIAPAPELVRSRLEPDTDWPGPAKTADLLSTAGLVLGKARPLPTETNSPVDIRLTSGDGLVHDRNDTLSLEPLLRAAGWAADYADQLGRPFAPGTIVMTGARIGPLPIAIGRNVADISGVGMVEISVRL